MEYIDSLDQFCIVLFCFLLFHLQAVLHINGYTWMLLTSHQLNTLDYISVWMANSDLKSCNHLKQTINKNKQINKT